MKDILGVSSLVLWEAVLPRFVEEPLSAVVGTVRPVDTVAIIEV